MRELIMEFFDPVIVRGLICFAFVHFGFIAYVRECRKP